jgi:1,4-alpha-glucan branching enzyme
VRSPYRAYRVTPPGAKPSVAALVRDPRSSMQVWSRHRGYPGDEWYLEFHKIRWPGGLKLWRVTGPDVDLGAKRAYQPAAALGRVREHARHFAHLLAGIASERGAGLVVAPFDTELFGHGGSRAWTSSPRYTASCAITPACVRRLPPSTSPTTRPESGCASRKALGA